LIRNLITNETGGPSQFLRAHETYHFIQQREMGFGKFYSRTLGEYIKYGINHVYGRSGTLENDADKYANKFILRKRG
jgi:hypothetical protein